jgi:hypothetical protein
MPSDCGTIHSQKSKLVADLRDTLSSILDIQEKPIRLHSLASQFMLRAALSELSQIKDPGRYPTGRISVQLI